MLLIMTISAVGANIITEGFFNPSNSIAITSIESYKTDHNGYWIKAPSSNLNTLNLSDSVSVLGKNNKDKSLFILAPHEIIQVMLSKDSYSAYKKAKEIQNLNPEEWNDLFSKKSKYLSEYHDWLNTTRKQYIQDSVVNAKRLEEIRRKEEARRHDSIQAIINAKRQAEEDSIYRESHDYRQVDISSLISTNGNYLKRPKCLIEDCDYRLDDSILTLWSLCNDTLVTVSFMEMPLDLSVAKGHAFKLNDNIISDPIISRHIRVFKDSLSNSTESATDQVKIINHIGAEKLLTQITKKAPNGYIDDWEWDNEYGSVTFNVSYTNTNKKTIKYIKFFFTVYNAVNDVRGSGSVSGTGPVEEFSTARWEFDNTHCWVAGDATTMKITKIHITYMNGSTVTLTGNKILIN